MKVFITGGLGFIGSNLVRKQLMLGNKITTLDNLSTGSLKFLTSDEVSQIEFIREDLVDIAPKMLEKLVAGSQVVFHLAANADVRGGWGDSYRDIEQNVIATHKIADAARKAGVEEFVFTSTGCVYGDSTIIPTPESEPFPIQTSLYGASKVAAEGMLSSYAANGAFSVTVLRFVSVLGENYHHGHVIDFVRKLTKSPSSLEILGNGKQKKSYVNVTDCVNALIDLRGSSNYSVFNIGHQNYLEVHESATLISKFMGVTPVFNFGSENRGWVGDNPFTFLDISKAEQHGWYPSISIEDSIKETVGWLVQNPWVLELEEARNKRL
jgi:UDP-glucose 4-epimerase